ncbi:hypothetical protein C5167_015854 [Papaver somniferum]|uniref:Uncharacterized protein n=1 Tax=Papaver somniferum TaxID=3469 RepID=A0A4Y7JBI8_PAPSO|nr:golgin subfamily B member 1-like [Papaver somniferum]RZC56995.1 hypothetical protein C5167_015854 [Papaver somniferum]
MATSKFLLLTILFTLVFVIRADSGVNTYDHEVVVDDSSSLRIELDQLKSKISLLESSIEDKTKELKGKDDSILRLEAVIQQKSDSIKSLQTDVKSLQKKGNVETAEQVGKAHARAGELEKQVEKLNKEIESQGAKKSALETRAIEAENKLKDFNLKLENLGKVNEDQKSRIRKTERALLVAEEELMRAKYEASSKMKELMDVHAAWFPPWLATHLVHTQSYIVTNWNKHGKPALDVAIEKALEKKTQAQKWAEPHVESVKTKLVPALKEQWVTVTTHAEPHVQTLTTKTVEVYESSKKTIAPHVEKAQKIVDPYLQEVKKISKPYIDQVATAAKPHVDKARIALKPYTAQAVVAYTEFLKSATTYHHQVQATVQETLNRHEITKPLATKELVWFVASALLALPVYVLLRFCSCIFCKKGKKPARNTHTTTRRRAKRAHADK